MCYFFCRVEQLIEISRCVKKCNITIGILHNSLLNVCIIVMVHLFSVRRKKKGDEQGLDIRNIGRWPKNPLAAGSGDRE